MKKLFFKTALVLMIVAITIVNVKGYSGSSQILGTAILKAKDIDNNTLGYYKPNVVPTVLLATLVGAVTVASAKWAQNQYEKQYQQQANTNGSKTIRTRYSVDTQENIEMDKLD